MFLPRPIYVLFRNVVTASDALDFRRIQDTAESLKVLSKAHNSIVKTSRVCSTLVTLYTELCGKVIYSHKRLDTNWERSKPRCHLSRDDVRADTADFGTTSQLGMQTLTAETGVFAESMDAFLYGDEQFLESCMNDSSHIFGDADLDWLLQRPQSSMLSQQASWNELLLPPESN